MKGIEPEAREAAKDAARKAGLTLGQWLNQKILDEEAALAELPPATARAGGDSDEPAAAIRSRLDALNHRLNKIAGIETEDPEPEEPESPAGAAKVELAPVVERLDRADEHLSALSDAVASLAERIEARVAEEDARSVAALEKALTGVVDHIELTDRRNGEVLKSIQARLSELASRSATDTEVVDSASREAILALEDRIGTLVQRIENAERPQPGIDVSVIERNFAELSRRVDEMQERWRRNPAVEQIESRLSQLTAKFAATERMMAAQTEVNTLRGDVGKLREEVSRVREPSKSAAVQALESRLNTVSKDLTTLRSSAAPASALNSLSGRLEQVLARLSDAEPAVKAASRVQSVEQRLADLAQRLDRSIHESSSAHPRIAELETKIDDLANRYERMPEHPDPLPTLRELEDQVNAISQRLDNTEQHFGSLRSIETSLEQLFESLESTRKTAIDAAEQAAFNAAQRIIAQSGPAGDVETGDALAALERGLAEVKVQTAAADQHNHDTLEAIHDTLKRVIERLGALEERASNAPPAPEPSAAAEPVASQTGSDLGDFRLPPMPDFSMPPTSPQVNAEPPVMSGQPHENEQAERPAADPEAGGFAEAYDEPAATTPRNEDFIAAARRAALAANEEAGADPGATRGGSGGDRDSQGGLFRGRRRTLLFVAAALFAIAGALSVSGLLGRNARDGAGPAVSTMAPAVDQPKPAEAAEEAPDAAPAATEMANYLGEIGSAEAATDEAGDTADASAGDSARPEVAFAEPIPVTAPRQSAGEPGESVLQPRGLAAAAPLAAPTIERVDATASAEPTPSVEDEPDSTLMTALAIDQAPAQAADAPIASGPPDLAAAAEGGDPRAQFELGARYADGRAGEKSAARASQWYQRAAAQGLAPAQYRLGALYEKGQGVPQDKGAAQIWYQRAAEQGNVKAMHNLAVLLASGATGNPDYARAARWFSKAAGFGLADSQYNLAILHERGLGVERDQGAAYKWFAIAAASGDTEAEARMKALAAELDSPALAAASAEAQSWRAATLDREANIVELPPEYAGTGAARAGTSADPDTVRAQTLLSSLGYDPGPADGLIGPRTREAIAAFERERGLPETGVVTEQLLEHLDAATAG